MPFIILLLAVATSMFFAFIARASWVFSLPLLCMLLLLFRLINVSR